MPGSNRRPASGWNFAVKPPECGEHSCARKRHWPGVARVYDLPVPSFSSEKINSNTDRFSSGDSAFVLPILTMLLAGALMSRLPAGENSNDRSPVDGTLSKLPVAVTRENFAALMASSPFRRPLDLSKSLVLSGIGNIDGELFATLFDRETRETHIVSRSSNPRGWQIVGVDGDRADLETVTARIAVEGGEVFSVRFDETQLKPEPSRLPAIPREQADRIAQQARNYREGISGDGFPGPPPREIADKLSKLSEENRKRLIYEMEKMRNRGASSEERRQTFVRLVDRALRLRQ